MKKALNNLFMWFIYPLVEIKQFKRKEIINEAVELIHKKITTSDLSLEDMSLVLISAKKRLETYLGEQTKLNEDNKKDIEKAKERLKL